MEFETECQASIDKLMNDKQARASVLRAVKRCFRRAKKHESSVIMPDFIGKRVLEALGYGVRERVINTTESGMLVIELTIRCPDGTILYEDYWQEGPSPDRFKEE